MHRVEASCVGLTSYAFYWVHIEGNINEALFKHLDLGLSAPRHVGNISSLFLNCPV